MLVSDLYDTAAQKKQARVGHHKRESDEEAGEKGVAAVATGKSGGGAQVCALDSTAETVAGTLKGTFNSTGGAARTRDSTGTRDSASEELHSTDAAAAEEEEGEEEEEGAYTGGYNERYTRDGSVQVQYSVWVQYECSMGPCR
jgi:hypothetical protein